MRIKTIGYITLVLGLVISASTPIAYSIGNNMPVLQLAMLMSLVGTVGSFAIMLLKRRLRNVGEFFTNRVHFLSLLSFTFFLYIVITLGFSFTTHHVSAALVSVVYRTWPLMLMAIAPIILRERINKWEIIGVLVGFALFAVTLIGNTAISLPLYTLPFVLILLGIAFSDAFGTAVLKRYNFELYSTTFIANAISFLFFAGLAAHYGVASLSGITADDFYAIMFLGVAQNIGLALTYVYAVRTLKVSVVSTAYLASPFITMILGALVLGQPIEAAYVIVALGVVAGIALQRLGSRRASNYIVKNNVPTARPTIYDVSSVFANTRNMTIYNALKGNGRALAFAVREKGRNYSRYRNCIELENVDSDGCMLLTNRTHSTEFSAEELEFIKDILGHGESDVVFIGVGEPDKVEAKLNGTYTRFDNFGSGTSE